jgi:hypothetical protein
VAAQAGPPRVDAGTSSRRPLRGPLGALLGADAPTLPTALRAVRLTYAVVFMAQTLLALLVSVTLMLLVDGRPRPSDVLAGVLLAMSLLHVVIGLALGYALAGRPGRGAAIASATAAAVALSVTAWFAALMVASGQRPSWLVAAFAVVSLAYLAGFALTPRCARAALRPEPSPKDDPAETPETA